VDDEVRNVASSGRDDVSDGRADDAASALDATDDAAMRRVADALRAPGAAARALDRRAAHLEAAVMAAIARPADADADDRATPIASRQPWLMRPRTLTVRPLTALAGLAAAALVAATAGALVRGRTPAASASSAPAVAAAPAPTPATGASTMRLVQFVLLAPDAREVSLVGDFNGWQGGRTPLHRASDAGLWTVEIPLAAGRYTYTFVVDGSRFTPDPSAPRAQVDDFGTPSSVVTVGGGHT
jgi:hypothetical protein